MQCLPLVVCIIKVFLQAYLRGWCVFFLSPSEQMNLVWFRLFFSTIPTTLHTICTSGRQFYSIQMSFCLSFRLCFFSSRVLWLFSPHFQHSLTQNFNCHSDVSKLLLKYFLLVVDKKESTIWKKVLYLSPNKSQLWSVLSPLRLLLRLEIGRWHGWIISVYKGTFQS